MAFCGETKILSEHEIFEKRKRVHIPSSNTHLNFSKFYCQDFLSSKSILALIYSKPEVSKEINPKVTFTHIDAFPLDRNEIDVNRDNRDKISSRKVGESKKNDKSTKENVSTQNKESKKNNKSTKEIKSTQNKKSKKKNESKKDYHGRINFILIPSNKGDILNDNIQYDKSIVYSDYINNKYKSKNKDDKPTRIISLFIGNILKAPLYKNSIKVQINSVEVRQINKKNGTDIKYSYHIEEGKEKININLYTNQGEDKYKTEITFLDGKEKIITIKDLKIESTRNLNRKNKEGNKGNMNYKNNKMFDLIIDFLKEIENEPDIKKFIIETFIKINDSGKLKDSEKLNKEMLERLKEWKKNNELKKIYDFIKLQKDQKPGLLILCFEYIYRSIIDKYDNTKPDHHEDARHGHDDWSKWKKFLTGFHLGINCKNNYVIFIEKNKRRMDPNTEEINSAKRRRVNDDKEVASGILYRDSESELPIS